MLDCDGVWVEGFTLKFRVVVYIIDIVSELYLQVYLILIVLWQETNAASAAVLT